MTIKWKNSQKLQVVDDRPTCLVRWAAREAIPAVFTLWKIKYNMNMIIKCYN